ncbi:MAG: hypothetical protein GX824_00065 [Clostridiales bacterium]|jgi:CDP-glycerol glycerophosphotransferase|nr:hypothetical protein [Clostridiales bacterium]
MFIGKVKSLLFALFCKLLPVKKNKIVFSSFVGKHYACNPRAIYEYLRDNYPGKFEFVWLFDFEKRPNIPDELRKDAKCVSNGSLQSYIEKATAGVWCFNHRNTYYYHKKKNQFYIQTWHGDIGFKGFDKTERSTVNYEDPYIKKCIKDSSQTDIITVGSEQGYNYIKSAFFYNGEFLKKGCPRNDALFKDNPDMKKKILHRYDLPENTKILLFAPTFRKGFTLKNTLNENDSNYSFLRAALSKRFGGEWEVFVKYHPACEDNHDDTTPDKSFVDVTYYGDMTDLIIASDALITDYSSVSFDFCLTKKPCWLYTPDWEDYKSHDRNIVLNIDDIAFKMCGSHDELIKAIDEFDCEQYEADVDKMLKKFNSYENGNACRILAQRILKECKIK